MIIFCDVKIIWNSNLCIQKLNFIGTQPCLPIYYLWLFFSFKLQSICNRDHIAHKASTIKALYRISFAGSCFNVFCALLKSRRLKTWWWSKECIKSSYLLLASCVMYRKCLRLFFSYPPLKHNAYTPQCTVTSICIILVLSILNVAMGEFLIFFKRFDRSEDEYRMCLPEEGKHGVHFHLWCKFARGH